jgi:hypothetical protein
MVRVKFCATTMKSCVDIANAFQALAVRSEGGVGSLFCQGQKEKEEERGQKILYQRNDRILRN